MTRRGISSGSAFEAIAGYSRAVVDGDWVFLSGTTGYDYAAGTISDDVVEQALQTFRNIWAISFELDCVRTFDPCLVAVRRAYGSRRCDLK